MSVTNPSYRKVNYMGEVSVISGLQDRGGVKQSLER